MPIHRYKHLHTGTDTYIHVQTHTGTDTYTQVQTHTYRYKYLHTDTDAYTGKCYTCNHILINGSKLAAG